MTSYLFFSLLLSFFLLHIQTSHTASNTTTQYLLPLVKDVSNRQYFTTLELGTPPRRVFLTVDLANLYSWMECYLQGYNTSTSSTMHDHSCHFRLCALYGVRPRPWCIGTDMCGIAAYTPSSVTIYYTGVFDEVAYLYSAPSKLSKIVLPRFAVACTNTEPMKGISKYTKGIASFAKDGFSIPSLVSSNLGLPRKFALCVPSSDTSSTGVNTSGINGAVYFGGGPYYLPPSAVDFSKLLVTTPLVTNPVPTGANGISEKGDPSYEYFIRVRSIKINKVSVRFNSSLLSVNNMTGSGGTKISTMEPYTVLHTDIYNPLVQTFASQSAAFNMTRMPAVGPFGACFSTRGLVSSTATAGPNVPIIDLVLDGTSEVLHGKSSRWRIYGANSMVRVSRDVACLGFVDGGRATVKSPHDFPTASITIGGYQMENNLVELDLEGGKLGITSSLLRWKTSCSQIRGY